MLDDVEFYGESPEQAGAKPTCTNFTLEEVVKMLVILKKLVLKLYVDETKFPSLRYKSPFPKEKKFNRLFQRCCNTFGKSAV